MPSHRYPIWVLQVKRDVLGNTDLVPCTNSFCRAPFPNAYPEGLERHLDAARQTKLPRDNFFAAQLPRKYPLRGGLAHRTRSDFRDLRLRCPSRTPEIARFPRQEKAMLHCDLRVRWRVASDLRFRAAISEPKTPSFCWISGDLAQSTRKSLAIAIVRFWCAKAGRQF